MAKRKPNYTTPTAMFMGSTGKFYKPKNKKVAREAVKAPFIDVTLHDAAGTVGKVKVKKVQQDTKAQDVLAAKREEKSRLAEEKKIAGIRREERRSMTAQQRAEERQKRANEILQNRQARAQEKLNAAAERDERARRRAVEKLENEKVQKEWAKRKAHQRSWGKNKKIMKRQWHKLISF